MWTEKDVPEDYLTLANKLVHSTLVTKTDFIYLCKVAIRIVETGKLTPEGKANMFVYIADIWLRHDSIDDGSITSDIGGQFAEWEIPGTLNLKYPVNQQNWQKLKSLVAKADKAYCAD
jgi:hypothetical protein